MRTCAAMALLVLASASAWGEGLSDEERTRRAKAHFDLGQTHYELKNWSKAAAEFEEGYRYRPLSILLWNAAQAQRHAGQARRAIDLYRRYLAAEPATPKRADAERYIAELERAPRRAGDDLHAPEWEVAAAPPAPAPAPARATVPPPPIAKPTPPPVMAAAPPPKPAPPPPPSAKPTPPPVMAAAPPPPPKPAPPPPPIAKPTPPPVIVAAAPPPKPAPPPPPIAKPAPVVAAITPKPAPPPPEAAPAATEPVVIDALPEELTPRASPPSPALIAAPLPAPIARAAPPIRRKRGRAFWIAIGSAAGTVVVAGLATAIALAVPHPAPSTSLGNFPVNPR
ncbi:MAG TPA: hypothetical protein VFF06_06410 [Polyangia bacterium]|nr:hypothetical protein [Polyangia bacterium]